MRWCGRTGDVAVGGRKCESEVLSTGGGMAAVEQVADPPQSVTLLLTCATALLIAGFGRHRSYASLMMVLLML
ncbi:hypothetical protein LINPERHAP1_LOCUS26864 [Linum perenne]